MKGLVTGAIFVGCWAVAYGSAPNNVPIMCKFTCYPLDTLSYAMGVCIGNDVSMRYKDLPWNYDELERGLSDYPADPLPFDRASQSDSISYGLGYGVGRQMTIRGLKQPFQKVWMKQGIEDAIAKDTSRMTVEHATKWLQHYYTVTLSSSNKQASDAWLAKIAKKSGVRKTESGLLYKIIRKGKKKLMPTDDRDEVTVSYMGRRRTGEVFDSSVWANRTKERQEMLREYYPDEFDENGNPRQAVETMKFALYQVVEGWQEGMRLIGKGGKIQLWISAKLAYGENGIQREGVEIGPNEALEFEVELVNVAPYATSEPDESAQPVLRDSYD